MTINLVSHRLYLGIQSPFGERCVFSILEEGGIDAVDLTCFFGEGRQEQTLGFGGGMMIGLMKDLIES
jgi:hypothetical protein